MLIRRVVLVFPLLLSMSGVPLAYGQDLLSRFHPYVSVKEEYSDNLDLTPTNKKEDFFTTIQPGIAFNNMDKVSGVDLDYSFGAVFYGKNSNLNYVSHKGFLNAIRLPCSPTATQQTAVLAIVGVRAYLTSAE